MYSWIDKLIVAIAGEMTDTRFESKEIDVTNAGDLTSNQTTLQATNAALDAHEDPMNICYVTDIEADATANLRNKERFKESDEVKSQSKESSSTSNNACYGVFRISDGSLAQGGDTILDLGKEKRMKKVSNLSSVFWNHVCPFVIFILLSASVATIIFHPLDFNAKPYRFELVNYGDGGFPVIFNGPESPKGSICVKGMPAEQIKNIGLVVLRNLFDKAYSKMRIIGEIRYPAGLDENLRNPFLYPSCTGKEKSLIECDQYGLGVAIPD